MSVSRKNSFDEFRSFGFSFEDVDTIDEVIDSFKVVSLVCERTISFMSLSVFDSGIVGVIIVISEGVCLVRVRDADFGRINISLRFIRTLLVNKAVKLYRKKFKDAND